MISDACQKYDNNNKHNNNKNKNKIGINDNNRNNDSNDNNSNETSLGEQVIQDAMLLTIEHCYGLSDGNEKVTVIPIEELKNVELSYNEPQRPFGSFTLTQ